jgi:hypothetical protein
MQPVLGCGALSDLPQATHERIAVYLVYYVQGPKRASRYCGLAFAVRAPSSKKTEPPDFDLFGSLRTSQVDGRAQISGPTQGQG